MTVPTVPVGTAPASPVTSAYARLAEVFPGMRTDVLDAAAPLPSGSGWVHAGALASGGAAVDTFLEWDEAQILRDYQQRGRPDVVAGFGFHRYAWPASLLVTLPWFLHRRVPRVPVEDVAFQRALGHFAVRVREFSCLPDDPAASHPDARVVPDEAALRAEVLASVAAHMGPVLEGFGPRMRRGKRALWGMATDEIVEGLWYVAHLLGEETRAVSELERLLPGATKPYVGAAGFRELTGPNGESLPTRDRASCCFFYTIRPEDTCVTCPRTCDSDRVKKLSAAL
ncbi:(2Fe-2S)-binding protein [Streptomyces sp. NPDC002308]